MDIIKQLCEPLECCDVEARVGSINEKGFSLLLYKTARTDIKRLNSVCGMNWSNKHSTDNAGNITCEISIFDKETKQWYSRHDTGTESFTEKEKGSYSDSFKRAGFRWGIGLELYESPFIYIKGNVKKNNKGKYIPDGIYGFDITKFNVVEGIPQVEVSSKGRVLFTNITGAKKPEAPKKPENKPTPPVVNKDDVINSIETSLNNCNTIGEFETVKERIETKTVPFYEKKNDTNTLKLVESMIEATAGRLNNGS